MFVLWLYRGSGPADMRAAAWLTSINDCGVHFGLLQPSQSAEKTDIFVFIFHFRLHLCNHHHPPRFHRPPRPPRLLHPIRLRRLSSSSSSASSSSSLLVFLIRIILLVVFIRFVLIVFFIRLVLLVVFVVASTNQICCTFNNLLLARLVAILPQVA